MIWASICILRTVRPCLFLISSLGGHLWQCDPVTFFQSLLGSWVPLQLGLGRLRARSQATGQGSEPALTRSRLSVLRGTCLVCLYRRRVSRLRSWRTKRRELLNERPESSASGGVTRSSCKGRASLQRLAFCRERPFLLPLPGPWAQAIASQVPGRASVQPAALGSACLSGPQLCRL